MGYVLGYLATRNAPGLESLHCPLGGRRFRPSVEDFIDFLDSENFIEALDMSERTARDASRDRWLKQQLGSVSRSDPETARETLRKMG